MELTFVLLIIVIIYLLLNIDWQWFKNWFDK